LLLLLSSVRDRLIEQWNDTQQYWTEQDPKRVYYLSLEFLIGRCLQNHLINLDLQGAFGQVGFTFHFSTVSFWFLGFFGSLPLFLFFFEKIILNKVTFL
jgi:glucan phosphorylase